ncbi:DUF2254 domain-containing protein [Ulvibacterium marinum]|uniref:DUF2254 domain-containing protein n=1 Tax=Ulvibacterium marinum TaxID=2419782 RepID=A0A3B0BYF3_9FLAO|nr:DUF2254 domain-containing protein [Ulvibacterium marinum]RKN78715.1 DUF2254 domain-containing protein [Ulvibacterium marinum]
MKNFLSFFKKLYNKIIYSIAFYPVIITIGLFFLAWLSLFAEDFEVVTTLKEKVPHLIIQDRETARVILSTLVGSILSLTVFSFTMVMVVLNQASANFSPRLLPGLISNKRHQIILGVYIGTLTYCMIILISLGAYGVDSKSFGLSTMIAALLGVLCVGLFVSFINSISGAIQIHNIIDRVARSSAKKLKEQKINMSSEAASESTKDISFSQELKMDETGFYRGFDIPLIADELKDKDNVINILAYEDQHLWEGTPIVRIEHSLDEDEIEALRLGLHISTNRHEGNSSLGGMIKLMEVAVKAMSPGINDPGTAISVITRLGTLMNTVLQIPNEVLLNPKDCNLKVIGSTISGKILMQTIVQPIRLYSKKDSSVMMALINALRFIQSNSNISKEKREDVARELMAIAEDIKLNIENEMDKKNTLSLLHGQ